MERIRRDCLLCENRLSTVKFANDDDGSVKTSGDSVSFQRKPPILLLGSRHLLDRRSLLDCRGGLATLVCAMAAKLHRSARRLDEWTVADLNSLFEKSIDELAITCAKLDASYWLMPFNVAKWLGAERAVAPVVKRADGSTMTREIMARDIVMILDSWSHQTNDATCVLLYNESECLLVAYNPASGKWSFFSPYPHRSDGSLVPPAELEIDSDSELGPGTGTASDGKQITSGCGSVLVQCHGFRSFIRTFYQFAGLTCFGMFLVNGESIPH